MTKREDVADAHLRVLLADFKDFVNEYDRRNPFDRSGQLSGHVRTIKLRREAGSAAAALEDGRFRSSLYETLQAWGIGRRGSKMVTRSEFDGILLAREDAITGLDDVAIGTPEAVATREALWTLISTLGIVENDALLVAHTKALHHILPDLVVPMDRAYTRPFLGWHGTQFQYQQEEVFRDAFRRFNRIAREARPETLVGKGWRSSATKVIDNAIVGFVLAEGVKVT